MEFYYRDKRNKLKVKTCEWHAKRARFKSFQICFEGFGDNRLTIGGDVFLPANDVCTTTCCRCPCTHEPSIAPSVFTVPSSYPSATCIDDDEYIFGLTYYVVDDYKSCSWIVENNQYDECDKVYDGILVKTKCKKTCNPKALGIALSISDGLDKGSSDGDDDGSTEGIPLGIYDGRDEGMLLGSNDCRDDGSVLGIALGSDEGVTLGVKLGNDHGLKEGFAEGQTLGYKDGKALGIALGNSDGLDEGHLVGQVVSWAQVCLFQDIP